MTASVAERVSFNRPIALPGVEVLAAEDSVRLWCVYHETYSICSVLDRGNKIEAHWRYRGRDYVATERSLMMMEPGELHVTRRLSHHGSFRVLMIAPAVLQELTGARDIHLRRAQESGLAVTRAFEALHEKIENEGTLLEVEEHFNNAIALWLERCTASRAPAQPRPCVRRLGVAREFLREHYAEPVRLTDLAAVSGLSPWHLSRQFRDHFGRAPHCYQLQLRLARARALLLAGKTGAETAVAVGFADQSALTRHFKTTWGTTPGKYAGPRLRTPSVGS